MTTLSDHSQEETRCYPTTVLASSEEAAKRKALALAIKEKSGLDLDELKVHVRPFRS